MIELKNIKCDSRSYLIEEQEKDYFMLVTWFCCGIKEESQTGCMVNLIRFGEDLFTLGKFVVRIHSTWHIWMEHSCPFLIVGNI